jgi:hypothetical protein
VKRDKKIERAAQNWAASRDWLGKELRLGHQEGMSYRKLAALAGLSHEQVRRIVQREE